MTQAIHPLTGEFIDPADEAAFLELTHPQRLRRARLVFALGAAVWLTFLLRDLAMDDPQLRLVCAGLRVIAVVPGAFLLFQQAPDARRLQGDVAASITVWFALQGVIGVIHPVIDDRLLLAMAAMAGANTLWSVQRFSTLLATNLLVVVPAMSTWLVRLPVGSASAMGGVLLALSMMVATVYFHVGFNTVVRQRQRALWSVEQQVDAREHLLSALAHELRTPMARARMRVALAQESPQALGTHLLRIDADLEHLAALVDGVFRLGELEATARTARRETLAVRELLEAVADVLRGLSTTVTVEVGDVEPAALRADHDLLRTALQGLGTNAVRHARQRVLLEAHRDPQGLVFDVSDDGPGVSEELQGRIFEPFAMGSPERDRYLGHLGLGLAVVRRIAEAHGGSVAVDRAALGGARFRLRVAGT